MSLEIVCSSCRLADNDWTLNYNTTALRISLVHQSRWHIRSFLTDFCHQLKTYSFQRSFLYAGIAESPDMWDVIVRVEVELRQTSSRKGIQLIYIRGECKIRPECTLRWSCWEKSFRVWWIAGAKQHLFQRQWLIVFGNRRFNPQRVEYGQQMIPRFELTEKSTFPSTSKIIAFGDSFSVGGYWRSHAWVGLVAGARVCSGLQVWAHFDWRTLSCNYDTTR